MHQPLGLFRGREPRRRRQDDDVDDRCQLSRQFLDQKKIIRKNKNREKFKITETCVRKRNQDTTEEEKKT